MIHYTIINLIRTDNIAKNHNLHKFATSNGNFEKKNYFRYASSHNVHVNFKQNLTSRSVKTLRTNLFAKNRKQHKFATTYNKFEKKSMILDMHHRKTCMYIYFQTNQVSKSVNLISAHKCICKKKS